MNDFGFAVPADMTGPFCGTTRFAPTATLRELVANHRALITSMCWHDLESAVKLITSLAFLDAMPQRDLTAEQSLVHWENLEQHHQLRRELQPLLAAARAADYTKLIAELQPH